MEGGGWAARPPPVAGMVDMVGTQRQGAQPARVGADSGLYDVDAGVTTSPRHSWDIGGARVPSRRRGVCEGGEQAGGGEGPRGC